jgi:hypothetical protein
VFRINVCGAIKAKKHKSEVQALTLEKQFRFSRKWIIRHY